MYTPSSLQVFVLIYCSVINLCRYNILGLIWWLENYSRDLWHIGWINIKFIQSAATTEMLIDICKCCENGWLKWNVHIRTYTVMACMMLMMQSCENSFRIFISPNNEMQCELYKFEEILTSLIIQIDTFQQHCDVANDSHLYWDTNYVVKLT